MLVALGATAGFEGAAHAASKLQVLHSFQNLRGNFPTGGLIADSAGNLYGTTYHGGLHGDGIVFKLSPPSEGKMYWSETVLHSFDGSDGKYPMASLIADGAGNLYGTTSQGGPYKQGGVSGGVAFELTQAHAGANAWTEKVLCYFGRLDERGGSHGKNPSGSLIADGAGNLYGTTLRGGRGGRRGNGTVFELTPPADGRGRWTKTVLYDFRGGGANGMSPMGALLADGAGNLYGTTASGGASGLGAVYELSPAAKGLTTWNETVLYSFSNDESGGHPYAGLIADGAGNLYGTTSYGGSGGEGAVFELSPPAKGLTMWKETLLYAFGNDDSRGESPVAGLVADAAGNVYGTTPHGGTYDRGVVFELSPPPVGKTAWTEKVLHAFDDHDGQAPQAGLLADGAGNFYGTASAGGKYADGVVFKITP